MGGDAISDVLFGDYSPAARMTFTMYDAGITQRSMYDMNLRGSPGTQNGGITYQFYENTFGPPLWPFGAGLSFTTFSHKCTQSSVRASTAEAVQSGGPLSFECSVTNTGSVASDTVVLGWLTSNATDAPLVELAAFARVTALAPGKTASVNMTLPSQVK